MLVGMPGHAFEYDVDQVLSFVQTLIPGLPRVDGMRAIGLRRQGRFVAGVVYERFNGRSLWMHVAAEPGARWLTPTYRRACFAYPFLVCGVMAVRGYVDASNARSRALSEHMGCKVEARLTGAAADGGDVLIYVMRREDCRYV